ncbi:uncharacterized protein LOC106934515 isoform X1 [Poecilia latipinna]|uniref:uncharacterized protein LOC106934515 isoform X1 n=1 Tax=Poecilia latipinna TaxID=48699 RepID=UPI00072EDCFD|nr:PREDICTED: uncharacterized protein LOC106934515 isoform X1 [Poecilia latipinna]
MDVADMLIDKIFKWVELQKKGAEKFDKLATELEETKKGCNVSKVVGSSVSVGGAAAMTVSGISALVTGGAAIPFLFTAGAVASGLGLTTNVASDVVDITVASLNMNEAKEIGEKIENLEKGIEKLMGTLKEEGERREKEASSFKKLSPEDYVVERIVRAMAKREGLILNDRMSLQSMMSGFSKTLISDKGADLALLGISLASKFAMIAARKSGKSLVSNGLPELAASMGAKAAGKAVGRVGAGVVGLAFSVPELVINCIDVNNCKTEASQSLRKNAKDIRIASDQMETDLKNIQSIFRRLAKVKRSIETKNKSSDDCQTLLKFAQDTCKDESVRKWLREKAQSKIFSKLVDMFQFLKEKLDEEEKKNHSNEVDITFVAHGAITDSMMPASCLLPLPTVSDVVLYSPWNCYLEATAAYGIATGKIQPVHREFHCTPGCGCKVPDDGHRPKRLPDGWNSMKKAGNQEIPNIIVSPLKSPEDGVWKKFEMLESRHGNPGRNHILIPLILPSTGPNETIPLPVVTLALSLVLMFSRFQATLHLTVCLGKRSVEMKLDEEALKQQYACTINFTVMTSAEEMLASNFTNWLRKAFKAAFRDKMREVSQRTRISKEKNQQPAERNCLNQTGYIFISFVILIYFLFYFSVFRY